MFRYKYLGPMNAFAKDEMTREVGALSSKAEVQSGKGKKVTPVKLKGEEKAPS